MQTAHLLFWWSAIILLLNLPSHSQNKPPILDRIILAICTALVPLAMFVLDIYTWFYYAYKVWHDMTAFSIGYGQGQIDFGPFEYLASVNGVCRSLWYSAWFHSVLCTGL